MELVMRAGALLEAANPADSYRNHNTQNNQLRALLLHQHHSTTASPSPSSSFLPQQPVEQAISIPLPLVNSEPEYDILRYFLFTFLPRRNQYCPISGSRPDSRSTPRFDNQLQANKADGNLNDCCDFAITRKI
ncbi:hypothetical protein TWF679_008482 [Orbilia oligospora]|uniref:Uncharacterized protein n=1 Tax=Orbilia oligospora TaxID=2813651 RepID=A0A8H8V512_ORBOL|nr:hypothetical protein TWF679_008482 [Orbilia oligospora]